jgi:hypothetical protein
VQISVDGASAATHERVRPGSSFAAAIGAIERLSARGSRAAVRLRADAPQPARDRRRVRSRGRARLQRVRHRPADAPRPRRRGVGHGSPAATTMAARRRGAARAGGGARRPALSIYPWDIVTEIETRLESPQAMLLVVPNGKVKLLNALPFAPADLRRDSLRRRLACLPRRLAHDRGARLRARCRSEPALLRHANETWPMQLAG